MYKGYTTCDIDRILEEWYSGAKDRQNAQNVLRYSVMRAERGVDCFCTQGYLFNVSLAKLLDLTSTLEV